MFWVHASNATRIEQGYRDIAEQVKIPAPQDSKADIFQLVVKWLRNESNGKWMLIFDNADDDTVLLQEMQASGSSDGPTTTVSVSTPEPNVALWLAEESDIIG